MCDFKQMSLQIKALVVFRGILEDETMQLFLKLMDTCQNDHADKVTAYAGFAHRLFKDNENLTTYIWERVISDENVYVLKRAKREPISTTLEQCLSMELNTLQALSQITSQQILKEMESTVFLPEWTNTEIDFFETYEETMKNLLTQGYGVFANNTMFTFRRGEIIPVKSPDNVRLANLIGYERERQTVMHNTIAFLGNRPAAHVLLYGDAGTGKSATVKAIVNEFSRQGLRIIEVKKGDLLEIPELIEQLAGNPLKFILFIDDLSFAESNQEIGALKAILEGSVFAKTANVVIYATSNRRHLVKETFSERSGDDIHRNETIQEQASLSERFGLSVCFSQPDKEKYLQIVRGLVKEYDISQAENIDLLAEQFAIQRGGRSGRTARQFADYLKSME